MQDAIFSTLTVVPLIQAQQPTIKNRVSFFEIQRSINEE